MLVRGVHRDIFRIAAGLNLSDHGIADLEIGDVAAAGDDLPKNLDAWE